MAVASTILQWAEAGLAPNARGLPRIWNTLSLIKTVIACVAADETMISVPFVSFF
jgi:hypothetical protein